MIDLHTHSSVSDGTLTPRELVRHAADCGVNVLALTDHDTVGGVAEALEEARKVTLEGREFTLIPGIEISAGYKKRDIHILGLGVDHTLKSFTNELDDLAASRDARNEKMAGRFRAAGMPMEVSELKAISGSDIVTRAHFAKWLTEHGFCKDNNDAFDRFLGYDSPFFVEREYIDRHRAIELIHEAGGIACLAHPMLYGLGMKEQDELVCELKGWGLDGIEVFYSNNVSNDEDVVRHLALKYDLIMTGGSDFHGSNKPQIEVGTGRGNLRVPDECAINVQAALVLQHACRNKDRMAD